MLVLAQNLNNSDATGFDITSCVLTAKAVAITTW